MGEPSKVNAAVFALGPLSFPEKNPWVLCLGRPEPCHGLPGTGQGRVWGHQSSTGRFSLLPVLCSFLLTSPLSSQLFPENKPYGSGLEVLCGRRGGDAHVGLHQDPNCFAEKLTSNLPFF